MNNIHHPSNTLPAGEPNAARWQSAPQSLARSTQRFDGFRRWNALSACALALGLLAACGGGQAPEAGASVSPVKSSEPTSADSASHLQLAARGGTAPGPASVSEKAALARGAQLNQAALAQAEHRALSPGAQTSKSAYLSGEVAQKALALRIPAYRFYNTNTGAHFYTTSETERERVASTLSPPFSYEGPAFSVASDHSAGLALVHRFYNTRAGVHFYTISETERAHVVATLPQFSYEGVAYLASPVAGAGLVPLYRFYVPSRGFHFYTASTSERDNVIATLSATYTYEGIGYFVLASDWRAEKVPHTGVTSAQCYQAGSDTLMACGHALATDLNPQQDGHRGSINAMSYSAVGGQPLTSCVRDTVTGLVWEGKEASGIRAGTHTYTHLGGGAVTDVSAYLTTVNASNLCGYNNWRLPTRQELLTLVDYGSATAPLLSTTWFLNTASARHWSADALSTDASSAWAVDFNSASGWSETRLRSETLAVRLVRSGAPLGPRFSYSSVAYGADAANNLVIDAWTGLQWRRCEQGLDWNGSACIGASFSSDFTHQQALAHARDQAGWRLPNIKELASLTDLSVSSTVLSVTSGARIPPEAFPGAESRYHWTSTPYVDLAFNAWAVNFIDGGVNMYGRFNFLGVRLVRASP